MERHPDFNDRVLYKLLEDFRGHRAVVVRFAERFLELLPGRVDRIRGCVRDRDAEKSLDAVLSLRSTAAMAGAARLEYLASVLLSLIRRRDFARATALTNDLAHDAGRATARIEDFIRCLRVVDDGHKTVGGQGRDRVSGVLAAVAGMCGMGRMMSVVGV